MKNRFFIYASVLAGALACASCADPYKIQEASDPNAPVKALTIDATLSAGTGEGMKTTIVATDFLRVRFADASGKKVGRTQVLYKTSGEGASASFAGNVAVPNDATTVYAFLDNSTTNVVNFGSLPTVDDLSAQKGTLADAMAHQVICGSSALSGGKATVSLAYKTSIVKAVVSYPEDVTPVAGETTITLSCGQYDKVAIDLDATAASTKGDLTVNAAIEGKNAVAFFAVWAGLGEGMISSNIGSTKYGQDVDCSSVVAGKTSTVATTVETLVYSYKISDDEYTVSGVRGNVAKADPWITLAGGIITVAENTTGAIRTGSLVLDNGKTYVFTQFGANEFTGSWTLYSKLFDGNKRMGGSKGDFTANVTISLAKGENGNNVTISNLYPGVEVEGKIDIDYEAMTAKLGVYVSQTRIYKSSIGHCVLLPECASAAANTYWTGYNFCPKNNNDFSENNYDWLWFTISEDYSTAKYQYHGAGQFSPNNKYRYCGLSFVVASETAITGTAYDVIHQANYNGSNTESMYFKR